MVNSAAQITPTYSAASTQSSSQKTTNKSASGDMSQFMIMLMAQLKNQNPLDPMKDNDMLGQVAQLNSLNQLQDLNSKLQELLSASQIGYAASLVGKEVSAQIGYQDPIQGKVTGVNNVGGEWMVSIGDQTVPLSAITQVREETKA